MKTAHILLFCFILIVACPAFATMYQYVDKQGITHYTNELSDVPAGLRSKVVESPEVQPQPLPKSVAEALHKTEEEVKAFRQKTAREDAIQKRRASQINALKQKKAALEKEYQQLLKEKTALDNNKAFQAKRHRHMYKFQPQIIAMVKEEHRLKLRLAQLETKIKAIDLQIQNVSR